MILRRAFVAWRFLFYDVDEARMESQIHPIEFAVQSLLERLGDMQAEALGVRRSRDIEYVHRMRVASRRLRSALAVFEPCLPKRDVKAWRKQTRRLTKSLGDARDCDVQLVFLKEWLTAALDPKVRPGIVRLRLRLKQERKRQQVKVVKALDKTLGGKTLERMGRKLERLSEESRNLPVPPEQAGVSNLAQQAYASHLDELLVLEPFVPQPQAVHEHHQMRIAAKHLRYALEIFIPLYGKPMKREVKRIREMQALLGDLHDCDVWIARLPGFLLEEGQRSQEYFGHQRGMKRFEYGIFQLLDDCRLRRRRLYEEFAAMWQRSVDEKWWDELRKLVGDPRISENAGEKAVTDEAQAPTPR